MRTPWIVGMIVLLVVSVADARRLPGEWSNVYQGGGATVRVIGTFAPDTGTVQGRLRCTKGCPVRGKFHPTCSGDAVSQYCTGPAGKTGAGCTASGYVYRDVFEGTWECGSGTGGVLSFGQR
jgi:hypothetical protein